MEQHVLQFSRDPLVEKGSQGAVRHLSLQSEPLEFREVYTEVLVLLFQGVQAVLGILDPIRVTKSLFQIFQELGVVYKLWDTVLCLR
jgi:hypothetical protein